MEPSAGEFSQSDWTSMEQTGLFHSDLYNDDVDSPWIGGLQHGLDDDVFQHAPFLSDVPSPGENSNGAGTVGADLPTASRGPGPAQLSHSFQQMENQPTVSAPIHDALFARALLTNCNPTDIALPWETGVFREIFSDGPFDGSLVPAMPSSALCDFGLEPEPQSVAETVAKTAQFSDACPIFSRCVGSADDGPFVEMQEKLHLTAVNKILVVLRHDLHCSVTGRHILALGDESHQSSGALAIVEAVVGTRAPTTLVKRANALLSFLRWFDKNNWTGLEPFCEECIWRYLQHLKDSAAPGTKGSAALSAFRFAHHLLGFDSLGPALNSRRLVGICEIMMSKKRLLKQALVLTVSQVKGLHKALKDPTFHVFDRAVIAYLLFALYGRCRNSDLLMIRSIEPDFNAFGGFVTIQTYNHKTGRAAMLKARLLPIVIPARGVDGAVWVQDALDALVAAGAVLASPIDGPLLRAPSGNAMELMQRGLRASEVSSMLRRFIGAPDPVPGSDVESVSSHSLKATTLSWCARFGLSPSTRSLLGRHTYSLNETYAIYSETWHAHLQLNFKR